ncbi:arylsulfatase [Haloferula helveola]|uniref:Arylsulfatase n=1 Tax=Haloferula helveola TaxID=490095 RepID=A0ABN6H7U8_9BACT|nr:arylsulfatase [Haloferula helveola]
MKAFTLPLCAALISSALPAFAGQKPNILVLYADDLGFGDLTCYNPDSKIPTPNLDRLASEGLSFRDGHSSSGICTPSRYALLTGRHHWRDFHGIVGALGGTVFKEGQLTLPGMLKANGYRTAAIGKWHLGWDWDAIRKPGTPKKSVKHSDFDWSKSVPEGPMSIGFDSYFGDTVINFPPYAWIEDDKLVKAPDTQMDTKVWPTIKEGNWECRPGPMVTGWNPYENIPTTTAKGVETIKSLAAEEEPFFLYFAFPSPHAPIIPNDKFDGKSKAGPYGDFVFETDDSVGQLLAALEESGEADNTIVFFSADNGPERYCYARDEKFDHWSSHPLRGCKRDIHEGGHHVPFIIRYPGVTKAGTTTDALASQTDVFATLAESAGCELPEKSGAEDSFSLMPVLKGAPTSGRESIVHNTKAGQYALRHGDYLLIDSKTGHLSGVPKSWLEKHDTPAEKGPVHLYNLKDDIGQRKDLAEAMPEKVEELRKKLASLRESKATAPRLAE